MSKTDTELREIVAQQAERIDDLEATVDELTGDEVAEQESGGVSRRSALAALAALAGVGAGGGGLLASTQRAQAATANGFTKTGELRDGNGNILAKLNNGGPFEFQVPIQTNEIVDVWSGSSLQTNFPLPMWQMKKTATDGSVTFTDRQIQLRTPGSGSDTDSNRAYDTITAFDPSVPGRIRVYLSNITLSNTGGSQIHIHLTDTPDADNFGGDDEMGLRIVGNGGVRVFTVDDNGSFENTDNPTQNNAWATAVNYIELSWDGSTLTGKATDGTTEISESEGGNYPTGEKLHLKIETRDNNTSAAENADVDVDMIELGT